MIERFLVILFCDNICSLIQALVCCLALAFVLALPAQDEIMDVAGGAADSFDPRDTMGTIKKLKKVKKLLKLLG